MQAMEAMEAMVVTESVTVVTAAEGVMATVMEEDTAEVIGVDVTQIWPSKI